MNVGMAVSDYYAITFITLEQYNQAMGTQKTLDNGEVLLYCGENEYEGSQLLLGDKTWKVREKLTEFPPNTAAAIMMASHLGIVVKDFDTLLELEKMQQYPGTDYGDYSDLQYSYAFDLADGMELGQDAEEKLYSSFDKISNAVSEKGGYASVLYMSR